MSDDLLGRLGDSERSLILRCGELAGERGWRAFLVGGSVRDILRGRPQADLDVVVEGEGMSLAQDLARDIGGNLSRHHAFQTAHVETPAGARIDVATARREEYPHPGQLPQVVPGDLEEDLRRRDFTINTMAIGLTGDQIGRLVDPMNGRDDLAHGRIRVLHGRSFADDPTRILRALRFALRFDYRLDAETADWLREAVRGGYLGTVSGDRARRELAQMFEEAPIEGPLRLHEEGVLQAFDPRMAAVRAALEALQAGRRWYAGVCADRSAAGEDGAVPEALQGSGWGSGLACCASALAGQDRWTLARRLRLSRSERRPLIESGAPWARAAQSLGRGATRRTPRSSEIDAALRGLAADSLLVILATAGRGEPELGRAMRLYLGELQWVSPVLSGSDLLEMGVPEGPRVGETLDALRAARLDGRVTDVYDERREVAAWLSGKPLV